MTYLDQLARLHREATPGPWRNGTRDDNKHMGQVTAPDPNGGGRIGVARTWHPEHVVSYVGIPRSQTIANAELIAAAVNALPELLADAKLGQTLRGMRREIALCEVDGDNCARTDRLLHALRQAIDGQREGQ